METKSKRRSNGWGVTLTVLTALFLFVGSHQVQAQGYTGDPSNGEVASIDNGCMQDVFNDFGQPGDLNCTANDVSLATATNIVIHDDCAFPGDTVTFTANFEVDVTSGSRRDVGIYFASDGNPPDRKVCMLPDGTLSGGSISECLTDADCSGGKVCLPDGALTGSCDISTLPYAPSSTAGAGDNWVDLDTTNDTTTASNDFGYCSLDGGLNLTNPIIPCDGGSPAGGDAICVGEFGAGATCEEFGPGIQDICGDISKPNSSPLAPSITLTVVCVDTDGNGELDLPYCTSWRQDGANELCLTPLAAYPGTKSKCNCDAGFGIPINVPGQIIVDKVTLDVNGNPLPGDPTSFDFELTGMDNYVGAPITPVNFSLTDTSLPFQSTFLNTGTYQITELVPGRWELANATCTSDNGTPSVTTDDVTFAYTNGTDIALNPGEIITCTFNDRKLVEPPEITVTKTVTPLCDPGDPLGIEGPACVLEPGGDATFTVTVTNTSASDATLDTLVDDIYAPAGLTLGNCGSIIGQTLLADGGSLTCSFIVTVSGAGGYSETDVVTAVASNDAGSDTVSDDATVIIEDVVGAVTVLLTKTADPTSVPETGGEVTFTIEITHDSPDTITIDTLIDSIHGDLNGQGDCSLPQTLLPTGQPGDTYTCSFTAFVSGDYPGSETDIATATGTDDEGNAFEVSDDATVAFTDVLPDVTISKTADPTSVPETGGSVEFTIVVTNNSLEDATIDSLVDSDFDLATHCADAVGTVLASGAAYTCTFSEILSGDDLVAHENTATVVASDDDGNTDTESDDATVAFTDVLPDVTISKTADPTSVPETGGSVEFTIVVTNNSLEDATIDSLVDSDFDLATHCADAVGTVLASGAAYTCTFSEILSGDDLVAHENTATVVASDDDGNTDTESDDATVAFTDVLPDVTISKTADPTSVPETGGSVEFTIVVTNNSLEDATIDSLVDSDFDLATHCADAVGTVLASGAAYTCTFSEILSGDDLVAHENTATVVASDDDGNTDTESDDATVAFTDVLPDVTISKTADPTSVPETGGSVEFTIVVTNNSLEDATIDSLVDSDFDLATHCADAVGTVLASGAAYTCTFSEILSGDDLVAHENTATVVASDDDGNTDTESDDATVAFTDVLPDVTISKTADPTSVPETGGSVEFTIVVTNNSLEDATIDSLVDSDFDLATHCADAVGTVLASGAAYTCTFSEILSGDDLVAHENTATVVASDDDGNTDTESDDATVAFTDVLPDVTISKTADPTSVPETGGSVEFTIVVTNNSLEDATIDSLVDSDFDLATHCADAVGTVLASGAAYTCTFSEILSGDDLVAHENTATVVASDDDGNTDTESDDATVAFTDVLPDVTISKTADPTSVPETGGSVEFTIVVTNNSLEDATIDSLVDSDFDLATHCADAVGTVLASGAAYTCTFSEILSGDDLVAHENTATVVASDDDGNTDTESDDATVAFTDVLPDVTISKTADPTSVPETGGSVEFTIVVTNNSLEDATIDSLVDSDFDLATHCADAVGTVLASGAAYTCTFSEILSGDDLVAHENTATVVASDDDGNTDTESDDATVAFTDVLPDVTISKTADPTSVPETGGSVEFTIVVTNNSLEDATIDSLVDSDFDLATHCADAVGTVLASGAAYTCTFSEILSGDDLVAHENTATVVASDDDGNTDTESDDATVAFTDVLPDVTISKTADPTSVPETGGSVEFTIVVTNNSLEDATIDSLVDSDFDLATHCADAVGTVLASGAAYTCTFSEILSGDDLVAHENTATVVASDDDGNTDTESDDATVAFTDVLPDVTISKTADPTSVPETGGSVEFTIVVTNNSLEDATIDSLVDSDFDLATHCADAVGTVLASGAAYTCTFSEILSGDDLVAHENTATVVASDDDGNTDTESDDATVAFTDVLPDVTISKTADPTSVPETGGSVEFTIVVTNNSLEDATIDSLVDSDFDLATHCADAVGTVLASGAAYTCTFSEILSGDDLVAHENTATVVASDDDGNTDTESDDATVAFTDVLPDVTISKTADPISVPEPGANVEFTIVVTNNSLEDATIDSLVDTDFDLAANCADAVGSVLASGASYTCMFTEFIAGNVGEDHQNTATVVASDNDGNSDTESDSADVAITNVNPAISVDKTADQSQVFAPGEDVTFTVVIENNSVSTDPVTINSLTDSIHGDLNGQGNCAVPATIASGDSYTCSFTVLVDGDETDVVTASGTDDEGTPVSDSDDAVVEMINPVVEIVKTFADDTVIAGGAGSSFDLVVTNTGDVPLSDVLVEDTVDARLEVTGISGTSGADADSDADAQTVEWLIATLGVGKSATITVDFAVDSTVPEAIDVLNEATALSDYTDVDGDTKTVSDTSTDTIDILTEIELSIVKTFDPPEYEIPLIPQGTGQTFVLEVSNTGPSDAVDAIVTDEVDNFLEVIGITIDGTNVWSRDEDPLPTDPCEVTEESAFGPAMLSCTVDIPVGETVNIVVTYLAAPFLGTMDDGGQIYVDSPNDGAEFRFVFANGSVLEGNALTGPVYLDGVELDLSGQTLTKNDFYFTPPDGDPGFLIHLSCSDSFPDGWGESDGPHEGINSEGWRVVYFSIARYKQGGQFFRNCGNVVEPFDVENQAITDGTDSNSDFDTDERKESDVVTVRIKQGIELDKFQNKAKHASVHMTNFTDEDKEIAYIDIEWPDSNGSLRQITIDGTVVWTGNLPGVVVGEGRNQGKIFGDMGLYGEDSAIICPTSGLCDTTMGWTDVPIDWVLEDGMTERIAFHFKKKSARGNYKIRLQFTDGSFLSLVIP